MPSFSGPFDICKVVAARDSSADAKRLADYVCSGTDVANDDVEIQAALDAVQTSTFGGTVLLAPGTYVLNAGLTITGNRRVQLSGHGAIIYVPANVTGLLINQGSLSATRGAVVEGIQWEGQGNPGTIAIELRDTNWSYLRELQIGNFDRGILMHCATANQFVEGITLQDIVIRACSVYGIELRRTSGTNSFGQHNWRGVNINVGGTGTGLYVQGTGSVASLYRSRLQVGCWVSSNQIGFQLDGDFDNAVLDLFCEGATGSAGNTAVVIGSTATNLAKAVMHISFWGTIATQILNASNLDYFYQNGRDWVGGPENTTSPLRIRRPADTAARITMGTNGTSGGRITFGNGSGTNDVFLERAGTAYAALSGGFKATSLSIQTKAGTPVDGDLTGTVQDGAIVIDTTALKIWVRMGGVWKQTVALT